eukprot:TRINITY_DN112999_c0_g1_i1.p1 TRINITY_DN112999_c0_g1~~TRINITY_DN112999_c0_g1_i1.p1  ORF type:complete len:183 (-),score=25.71 TRINITY_DN112999_c0_g1_i1:113-661(-)
MTKLRPRTQACRGGHRRVLQAIASCLALVQVPLFALPRSTTARNAMAPAEGYFPARTPPPDETIAGRGGLASVQQDEEERETRLLREQTATLAQELGLLREVLQQVGPLLKTRSVAADTSANSGSGAVPHGVRFNEIATLRSAGNLGHRRPEALDTLSHLSQRVVARRTAGELPLGQVPSAR